MLNVALVGLVFYLFFSFNPQTNYYAPSWWLIVQAGITLLCYEVYKVTSVPVALLFFYIVTSSTYFSQCHFNHFVVNVPQLSNPFTGRLSKTLVCTIGLLLILIFLPLEIIKFFVMASPFLLFIGTLRAFLPHVYRMRLVYKGIHYPFCRPKRTKENEKKFIAPDYYGYGSNLSVHSTFMALLTPFALFMINYNDFYFYFTITTLVITFMSLIRIKASAGFGGFCAAIFTFLCYHMGFYVLIPIGIFLISTYFLNKYFFRGGLYSLSGRREIITLAVKHLRPRRAFMLLGNGVGSFSILFPTIQLQLKAKDKTYSLKQIYTFAHCDLFQFALDGGIIGLVLLFGAFGDIIYHAHATPAIMAFAAAFVVTGVTNFPCHMGKDSLLIILMIKILYSASHAIII